MKKIFFFLMLIYLDFFAQVKNLVSLPLSESPTNKELEFLKEELKGKQVVLLGENTHFDGNVFEYRNRVIKFLVEEMNFTTIAFESGVYDLYKANKEIKEGENLEYALQNSLMGAWAYSKEFMKITDVCKNNRLRLFGFDSQFTNNYGFDKFSEDLYKYLNKKSIFFPFKKGDFELLLESINQGFVFDEADISYTMFRSFFKKTLNQIKNAKQTNEDFYWFQIIQSLISVAGDVHTNKNFWTPFTISTKDNIRDKQMAKNLLMYVKRFPNEKILCLGANAHFIKDLSKVSDKKLKNIKLMGSYLKNELKDKMYSLAGVTATKETVINGKTYKTPIDSLSFEYFLLKKKVPVSFINTNQKIFEELLKHRLFSNDKFTKSDMRSLFDGYLLFKDYKISESIKSFKSNLKKEDKNIIVKGRIIKLKDNKPLEMAEVSIPSLYTSVFTDKDGFFEIRTKPSFLFKKEKLFISYLGYEPKELIAKNNLLIKMKEANNTLDEVVIKSNKQASRTLKESLKNIKKNFQTNPYNNKRYTINTYTVNDSVYLKFKIITKEYDRGAMSSFRESFRAEQINWIKGEERKRPKNLLELMQGDGFHQAIFEKRKLKKFSLAFESDTIIGGNKINVISFSTPRQQYIYTGQAYKSNYKGRIFINKEDKGIIRVEQNWDVVDFSYENMFFGRYLPFKTDYKKFKLKKEKKIVNLKKHLNKKYYVQEIQLISKGVAYNSDKDTLVNVARETKQYFYEFNYKGDKKINHDKNNINSFKDVFVDQNFWNNFDLKNISKK